MSAFDYITHKRNTKGQVIKKDCYRMVVDKTGRKLLRNGIWYYENNEVIPLDVLVKAGLVEAPKVETKVVKPAVEAAPAVKKVEPVKSIEPAPVSVKKVEPTFPEVKNDNGFPKLK